MLESHVFSGFNISRREHSFELKFVGYSNHKYRVLQTITPPSTTKDINDIIKVFYTKLLPIKNCIYQRD